MPATKTVFILNASYSVSKYGEEYDSAIHGFVGKPSVGSGTFLSTGIRDIWFEFDKEKEAKKALKRLKDQDIKGKVIEEQR